MPVQPSDRELIARVRAGDMEAFGQVYERYAQPVYRFAYHLLGNADEADDVKQDAFVRVYHALPGFRGECTLLTWLLKVTANLCRDRFKSQQRRGEMALLPEIATHLPDGTRGRTDPLAALEKDYLSSVVHRALRGLPVPQRELIVLRDLEELSYQQIADVLGCSVASVKLRLFRARRALKERVESLLKQ